jgi:ABC-type branched-subunit amino acid transport system substrate-binding protein
VSAYTKAFPGKQPGTWGTFTYDSARILFRAWDRAGTPFSYAKVVAQLRKTTNYAGATGKITINKVGNRPNVPVSILTVDSGGQFDVMYTNRSTK